MPMEFKHLSSRGSSEKSQPLLALLLVLQPLPILSTTYFPNTLLVFLFSCSLKTWAHNGKEPEHEKNPNSLHSTGSKHTSALCKLIIKYHSIPVQIPSSPPPSPLAVTISCCLEQSRRLPWLTHMPTELNSGSIYSLCHMQGAAGCADTHTALTRVIFSIGDKVTWRIPAKWGRHAVNRTQLISGDSRAFLCSCLSVSDTNLCHVFPASLKLWSKSGQFPNFYFSQSTARAASKKPQNSIVSR